MKLLLKTPVTRGSETISELTLRETMCAGDMRGILIRESMSWDDMLKVAGRLSAQPDDVMFALSMEDAGTLLGLVGGFMSGGPKAGNAS